MSIPTSKIGTFNGQRVDEAVLTSANGVSVSIMNWGCVVRDWRVPVGADMRSIVLGFDDFEAYPVHSPYFGAVVGRVANRIRNAQFELDGQVYKLAANEGKFMLHGGPEGLGQQVWSMETDAAKNAVLLTISSPDGHMGFPGNVDFSVLYTLTGNKLRLEFVGTPDRPTPISLVQHHYFNLGQTDSISDHIVQMPYATAMTGTDELLIPTGEIQPVKNTRFDFTAPRNLRDAAGVPEDYDLNFVLDAGRDVTKPIAIATGEDKAVTLKLWSDRPGLQFYDGVWTDVAVAGRNGRPYKKHSGLCFEDQMFPNAVNQTNFPSIICTPDNPYRHWCEIEVG